MRVHPAIAVVGISSLVGIVLGSAIRANLAGGGAKEKPTPGYLVARDSPLTWRGPTQSSPSTANGYLVTFHVANRGSTPVRILDIGTTCGCVAPRVEKKLVGPGEEVAVHAEAQPIAVGVRDVTINLATDSVAQPVVPLLLRVVGSQSPPYLLDVRGDLTYRADPARDSPRIVEIETIEPAALKDRPELRPTIDHPSFRFVATGMVERENGFLADTVHRIAQYRVEADDWPRGESFRGQLVVRSPWDDRAVRALNIEVDYPASVRAVPARLSVDADAIRRGEPGPSLQVLTTEPAPDIRAEAAGDCERLPRIEGGPLDEAGLQHAFRLVWEPGLGPEPSDAFEVRVFLGDDPPAIVVPVRVGGAAR